MQKLMRKKDFSCKKYYLALPFVSLTIDDNFLICTLRINHRDKIWNQEIGSEYKEF